MAAKPGSRLAIATALEAKENVERYLANILHELKLNRLVQTQRRYYTLPLGGQAAIGETQGTFEPVAQGQTFLIDRLTAFAPKGTQLEIYENSVQASNFLEVVANIQRYANSVPGTMVIEGPSTMLAVLTKAEAVGPYAITLGGLIVPTQALDAFHNRASVLQ
jgi:hypothetical protein